MALGKQESLLRKLGAVLSKRSFKDASGRVEKFRGSGVTGKAVTRQTYRCHEGETEDKEDVDLTSLGDIFPSSYPAFKGQFVNLLSI